MSEHTPPVVHEPHCNAACNLRVHYACAAADHVHGPDVNPHCGMCRRPTAHTPLTLVVTRWGHARWFDPHPPQVANVRLRADGDTGTHPLMAECATCHEVLLPVTFAATADTGLRERVEALTRWAVPSGYAGGPAGSHYAVPMVRADDLAAALDATPASTEDRADNEGTR